MIGKITYIISTAGFRAMNGVISDERRRLDSAIAPAAYVSYDPRMMSVVGWHGYRIAFKGGTRNMILYAIELLRKNYAVSERYDNYEEGNYVVGVLLRERAMAYALKTGTPEPEPDPTWLYFTMPNGGVVTLTKTGSPTDVILEYSLDNGASWTEWIESGNVRTVTLAAGQTVHIRNTSETSTRFSISSSNFYRFAFGNDAYGNGNINSLLCKNPEDAIITSYCYCNLFKNCSYLKSAPLLPSTQLDNYCYHTMFSGCTSLELPPALPAQTMATFCYGYMFYACTKLKEAPALPATTLARYCYTAMFYVCKMLVSTPYLPANIIPQEAYKSMFGSCSELKEVRTEMTNISASNSINSWLNNVSPTGDFYCPAELTIPTGASGIPSGWTRHDI